MGFADVYGRLGAMMPQTTQIEVTRRSDDERIFTIPHIFQGGVMLDGIYVAGIA
ncbi:MAG: hypothetical protein ABI901_01015 [Roseiflexaceae bacterium]